MENQTLSIPLAIVAAGIVIAGAIFLSGAAGSGTDATATVENGTDTNIDIAPITAEDHLRGNPDAPIIIVEYSDLECPFCKRFHNTMNRVMDEYGTDGRVAWVYRQFPIAQLHSKATKESEASECTAELGGNTAFWDYIDRVFEVTPSNNGLVLSRLPEIAEEIGLDRAAFEACLDSGKYEDKIDAAVSAAGKAGARGTPYSVMLLETALTGTQRERIQKIQTENRLTNDNLFIANDGNAIGVSGAFPYEIMSALIDTALGT